MVDPPLTEIIEGKEISLRQSVPHALIASNIFRAFADYLHDDAAKGWAFSRSVDVRLDDENIYLPDVKIVCNRAQIHDDGIYGAPALVVEVLSHRTVMNDRGPKMRHYAAAGVKEYWLVSPLEKSVEVYLNHDGTFELERSYAVYADWEIRQMNDEERAALLAPIRVSLYDDLVIPVETIFRDVDIVS